MAAPQPTTTFAGMPTAMAWAIIFVVLIAAASFKSTESLAAAFAWLIFIATVIAKGQAAMANLKTMNVFGGTGGGSVPKGAKAV